MGTINHRHVTTIPDNPGADISAGEWNDSLVLRGSELTGAVLARDTTAADGWSAVPAAVGILTCTGIGTLPSFQPATAAPPLAHHATHEPGGTDAIVALDASVLTQGTIADARLSANVAFKPIAMADGGTGVTTGLTVLNAANLATGIVPDARFPATLNLTTGLTIGGDVKLVRGGANILALQNGAIDQECRIYGATGYLRLVNSGGAAYIRHSIGALVLGAADGGMWQIGQNGFLFPLSDNVFDIGTSGLRSRSAYLGTSLSIGTNPATTGAIRLAYGSGILSRDSANGADVLLIGLYTSGSINSVLLGQSASSVRSVHTYPQADNLFDLGSAVSAVRWRNVFVSSAVCFKVKTGTPVDADVNTPTDGMMVLDSTANKIWVRLGGTWKGVAVA